MATWCNCVQVGNEHCRQVKVMGDISMECIQNSERIKCGHDKKINTDFT